MTDIKAPLRVHVVPVGAEIDRIVLPLIRQRADRVYLIKREGEELCQDLLDTVIEKIDELKIEMIQKECDLFDLNECVRKIGWIVINESKEGNSLFLNISSSSTIASIGCMLVSVIWGGEPYYVFPETYTAIHGGNLKGPMSHGMKNMWNVPFPPIRRPEKKLIHCLKFIEEKEPMKKKDLITRLVKEKLIDEGPAPTKHRIVTERFVKPLTAWGYIEEEGQTQSKRFNLTQAGRDALHIYSIEFEDSNPFEKNDSN